MPGAIGRTGFIPTPHTEMGRWAVENGLTSKAIAERMGINSVTVRRHFMGWGMHSTTSRLYRVCFPGIPVPLKGRPQRFENPLPIRRLPLPQTR